MKKAEAVAKYTKGLRKDKLKSYLLAICSGIIGSLMYKVGVSAGVNATCKSLAESFPDESYEIIDESENKNN